MKKVFILPVILLLLCLHVEAQQLTSTSRAFVTSVTSKGASYNPTQSYPSIANENSLANYSDPEKRNEDDFKIFPNPVTYDFTLELPVQEYFNVSIIDEKGKVVMPDTQLTSEVRINCQDLQPGQYFVRITNNTGVISKRIFRQ